MSYNYGDMFKIYVFRINLCQESSYPRIYVLKHITTFNDVCYLCQFYKKYSKVSGVLCHLEERLFPPNQLRCTTTDSVVLLLPLILVLYGF